MGSTYSHNNFGSSTAYTTQSSIMIGRKIKSVQILLICLVTVSCSWAREYSPEETAMLAAKIMRISAESAETKLTNIGKASKFESRPQSFAFLHYLNQFNC